MGKNLQRVTSDNFLLYQTEGGEICVQVRISENTVWLSLAQIAELFDRDKSVISKHIFNIFKVGELNKDRTVAKFATVRREASIATE